MFYQPKILTSSSYIKSHVSLSHIKTRYGYDFFFIFFFRNFRHIYIYIYNSSRRQCVFFKMLYQDFRECL